MKIALSVIIFVLFLSILYIVALGGRRRHPDLIRLGKYYYAHRGLHQKPEIPENSRASLKRAVAKGYGAEFDVHLLSDGGLAVFHDADLKRTTGAEGKIYELSTNELNNYRLEGTEETIPTFEDVLQIFEGRAPVIIELKTDRGNARALCEAVFKRLDNYTGDYCVESFDPRVVMWLKKNRPNVVRGQLCQNFLKSTSKKSRIIDFLLTSLILNLLTRPDFIAYKFADRGNISNVICLKLHKLQGVSWTIRNINDFNTATSQGLIPIFENFEPTL